MDWVKEVGVLMKCPFCHFHDTRVIDSRASCDGYAIRRRRECTECGKRFTTHEQSAGIPLTVIKKDESRVPFDRQKLRDGVDKACYKRPVSPHTLDDLIGRLEANLIRLGEQEIPSSRIGELVMEELRQLDQVAYVRFASVYRDFKDVSDFQDEIRPMLQEGGSGGSKKSSERAS